MRVGAGVVDADAGAGDDGLGGEAEVGDPKRRAVQGESFLFERDAEGLGEGAGSVRTFGGVNCCFAKKNGFVA